MILTSDIQSILREDAEDSTAQPMLSHDMPGEQAEEVVVKH